MVIVTAALCGGLAAMRGAWGFVALIAIFAGWSYILFTWMAWTDEAEEDRLTETDS